MDEDADSFPFDELPEVSILKANHGSGHSRVLRRPFDVDVEAARDEAVKWLRLPCATM